MEYFEIRSFCDPLLFPRVLDMEKPERHDYINPPILPEVMKNVLRESFSSEQYPVLGRDYFTAKNIATGKIETSANTVTIHHFASEYHSKKWIKIRVREQRVRLILGEKNILAKIIVGFGRVVRQIKKLGIRGALKYYYEKYI
jgi:hypothetical protein